MDLAPTDWSKVPDAVEDNNARYAMDSKLHVQFYIRPILQTAKSEQEGRAIFIDVDHIRIMIPGDKLSIIDRIASDDDKQRFAAHWAKYSAGKGDEVIGTRLEVVPWMTRSRVEEYKYFNIHTVEQLASAGDGVSTKFPGFAQDKQKAQQWLEATTGDSARIRELEAQVAQLLAAQNKGKEPAKAASS